MSFASRAQFVAYISLLVHCFASSFYTEFFLLFWEEYLSLLPQNHKFLVITTGRIDDDNDDDEEGEEEKEAKNEAERRRIMQWQKAHKNLKASVVKSNLQLQKIVALMTFCDERERNRKKGSER